ncbi:MAG: aldo/keto reductase [Acidimicrobiales bacterium]
MPAWRPDGCVGDQGRHPAAGSSQQRARLHRVSLRRQPAAARRRTNRPLPDPPSRLLHPSRRARRSAHGVERRADRRGRPSNYLPAQTDALQAYLDFPIVTDQPQFSLLFTDPLRDGSLDRAMRVKATPLAWSPLGGGSLATGEGLDEALLGVLDGLAQREGVDRAAIALAWVLAHPSRPVALVGSQTPSRLSGYGNALGVTLERSDVYALLQAAEGVPLP